MKRGIHEYSVFFAFILMLFSLNQVDCLRKYKRKYDTKKFKVPLDHFSFARNETFEIKYLVNDTYWDKQSGPIFFYTGNEGQVELFAEHTGFVWDIAQEFSALVVFAEHRYYGSSMPFGNKSLDADHVGYLTSSQALADYADLLLSLRGGTAYPVIAFGGSYGGMLAAYIRMKYPHLVAGAVAASAPVHQFTGMVPCDAFNRIVTSDFKVAGTQCAENIRKSWPAIRNMTKTTDGKSWLQKEWNLCKPIASESDVQALVDYLASVYTTLAMVNYPYECDFLVPLPGYPVRSACEYLKNGSLAGKPLLQALGKLVNMFANYTHTAKCIDYEGSTYGNLDAAGWDFQACTEMVMPSCSTGKDDMFEAVAWNETSFADDCKKRYGVSPAPNLAKTEYGGSNIYAASNIVFSNGLLDPWASGGILTSLSETLQAVIIVDGAHHLDLMGAHHHDTFSVVSARDTHKANIRNWIREFQLKHRHIRN